MFLPDSNIMPIDNFEIISKHYCLCVSEFSLQYVLRICLSSAIMCTPLYKIVMYITACRLLCLIWSSSDAVVSVLMCFLLCVCVVQLACNDSEVYEETSSCVSLLAQLYGGEGADRLQPEELLSLAHALQTHTEPRQQKLLLRVLKRMVSDCKH